LTETFDLSALKQSLDAAPDHKNLKPLGLQTIYLGRDALTVLPDVVAAMVDATPALGPVAVLSDSTPKRYHAGDLLSFVTGCIDARHRVRNVTVGVAGHTVHADEETLAKAIRDCDGAACLVAVGSGTVSDIGKAVAAAQGIGYIIVQTANSVNGYADDRSVLLINGVKRTIPTRWADVLIVDTDVLVKAPVEMNVSGFADLIATFTAPADWYLATLLGMDDSYSPTVVGLARNQGSALLEAAPLVPQADPNALEQVAKTLTLSGISMGIAGTTAPCSGMEHAVSHLLEMATTKAGNETALHGAQVGVTTIVAALLWQRVLGEIADGGLSRVRVPGPAESQAAVLAAFHTVDPSGAMGAECWRDYERKLARWAHASERIELAKRDWPTHEGTLRHLLATPQSLVAALQSAGAPLRFADLEPSVNEADARWAVANCHLMRERFSIADMANFLGIWDDDLVDELIADAAALGSSR